MTPVSSHRVRLIAGALVGSVVVAAVGVGAFARGSNADDADLQSVAAEPVAALPGAPMSDMGLDGIIVTESYRELSTYASAAGVARIFTATSAQRVNETCVGLMTGTGVGVSCSPTLLVDGRMHVQRTIIRGEKFLSGVVAPTVMRVSFVEGARRTSVDVENGTFLFRGTGPQGRLEAHSSAGNVLFTEDVEFSG